MGYLGTHQDSGYTVTDARAPITLKQLINFNNHVNGVGNQSTSHANPYDATNWDAPLTLKDMVKYQDYISAIGNSSGPMNQMQFTNAHTNSTKEIVSAGRAPTNSNVSMIPEIKSLGAVELKEHINIDRFNPARQTNFNSARPEINQMNKMKISYGDNINQSQMDTLITNPYYINGVNQSYHYMNNPNYKNTISNNISTGLYIPESTIVNSMNNFTNHQQPMQGHLNQSICSTQNHWQ
jgi:hypothetical protein